MPIRMIRRNVGDSDLSPCYYAPVSGQTLDVDRLKRMRATLSQEREALLAYQKAATDRETARFFKADANDQLKLWRAADAWIKWALGEPGWRPESEWPCELAKEFDYAHGVGSRG